jgi:hypothetical protein
MEEANKLLARRNTGKTKPGKTKQHVTKGDTHPSDLNTGDADPSNADIDADLDDTKGEAVVPDEAEEEAA